MPDKVNEAAVGIEEKVWYHVFMSRMWAFFNSLKLTLFILITLASVSIFGTVIEQGSPIETYLSQYGETWTRIVLTLRLHDMYHSYWFIALLATLALNIVVCTFERFPPKWKSLLNTSADFNPELIDRLSMNQTIAVRGDAESVKERLFNILKKKRYRVKTSVLEGGGYNLYAWKGSAGRLGSDVTHISLLLILLGAIIGSFYGYKDFKAVYVGGKMTVPQADFELRLDKFWIEYYDTGQIRQYNSLLTVIENGKEVLTKQIWVNEPLYYKGIRFYQSSYGMAWNKIEQARISVKRKDRADFDPPVVIPWGELKKMPGTRYSVKVAGYVSDFAFDEKSKMVFSKSPEPNNPAVRVEVYDGDKLVSTPWLFMNYPGIFAAIPNAEEDLVFVDFLATPFSGISVNKDPGTNIVWLGTAVMGLGFMLAFFVYYRRIWVTVKDTGNSSEVRVGGIINKNNFVFEREFKELVDAIKARV